jgi:hypothetical protein
MSEFSGSSIVTTMPYAYLNFLNKGNDPLQMQVPNCFGYLSIFVDTSENLVIANDVIMPSNPLVTPVEKEKLEETSLDVNVFQRSCEEILSIRVMCT